MTRLWFDELTDGQAWL